MEKIIEMKAVSNVDKLVNVNLDEKLRVKPVSGAFLRNTDGQPNTYAIPVQNSNNYNPYDSHMGSLNNFGQQTMEINFQQ